MLAAVFLGEKITVQKLAWLSVAFLGMLAIVTAHGEQTGGGDYLVGIALALGAAFLYAVAALIIKRLKEVPPHLMALIQVATGALLLAPLVPWNGLPASTTTWAALVTLGVVHTGLMYVLLYGAIQKPADGHYRRTVVHLPDCGDLCGLDCVRASPGVAAMAGRGGDSVGSGRVAAGLVVAPQPR